MTGFIYKEWKQNRNLFLVTAVFALLIPWLSVVFMWQSGGLRTTFEYMANPMKRSITLIPVILGFLVAGSLQNKVFYRDEKKKWGYFITVTSEGIKGFLYTKYMMILGMSLLTAFCLQLGDVLLGTVVTAVAKVPYGSMAQTAVFLVYTQLFLRAIDIPFIVRFGSKKGEICKLSIIVILLIGIILFANACPQIAVSATNMISDALNREGGRSVLLLSALMPFAVIGVYIVSFEISCKLYLKGVEQYDK